MAAYKNDKGYTSVETLAEIGRAHNATIAQTAIAWNLANPTVTAAIVGANTVAQLSELVNAATIKLLPQEKSRLDTLPSPT